MKKKLVLCTLAVVLLGGSVFATDIEECFFLNAYFNRTPVETHAKIAEYERRLESDKNDYYSYLALAVLYSALSSPMENPEKDASEKVVEYSEAFVSRDSRNPFTQLKMVKKAIKLFDEAIALSAGQTRHWFVRYMRGNFYINLPASFKKRGEAEMDFFYIKDYYSDHADIEGYMCNAYYYLGEIEKTRGNPEAAVGCWKNSVAINERLKLNSREADQAAERLKIFAD